jgi:glycosyltransferase involved in cell wall biosynthesis
MDLVSVIIPTYNRFEYLLNTIKSIKNQTYKNIEIIVVNDNSTQIEYHSHNLNNVLFIHMQDCTKKTYGYINISYLRNQAINIAKGKYIAFCNDNVIWFPNKIELQLKIMKESGCKFSCTDGFIGEGIYNSNDRYKKYNAEYEYYKIQNIYKEQKRNLLENGFPKIWDLDFLKIHNCIVSSSVIIDTEIFIKANKFINTENNDEDYNCWLRALEHTNCVYIPDVCFYYDYYQ